MKILILGGINEAGKSQTLRFSVRYLDQSNATLFKFEHSRNPPKKIIVGNVPVYIYICSPQELTEGNAEESRRIFKKRIDNKEPNAIVITTFNLEDIYNASVEACLDEVVEQRLKKSTYFVFLDARNVSLMANNQARARIAQLERRGFNILGEITRIGDNRIQRGKEFAEYIKRIIESRT
jgi:hypothetical protein